MRVSETRTCREPPVFDAEVSRSGAAYELAAEVGVPEIAQALASTGRRVAVVTDETAYGLHPVAVTDSGGHLHITLYAAWRPTHYAVEAIRELATALSAFCATGLRRAPD